MRIHLPAVALLSNLLLAAVAWAAPELSVEQGSFDFGTIPQGKQAQHNFTIKNSGDAPLQIKQVEADCGCTAAKPSSSLILPGRSAELHVTFDSTSFSGKVQKKVTLTTNAGKTPKYVFQLNADIVDELQAAPRQLSLGPVAAGVAKQVTIAVTNRGGSRVKLLSVKANSNSLDIKPTIKKGDLKPGETGLVELTITPRPEAKVLSGYVHIVTDSAQKKEITVPVYASVAK